MSYEIDYEKEIKCPCGKGTIKYIHKSNDWSQTKEETAIHCVDCGNKYKIVKEVSCRKPAHESVNFYCVDENGKEKILLSF